MNSRLVAGLLLALTAIGCQPATQAGLGRYQIINGTLERNIMLLDTVTGEAWRLCTNATHQDAWCPIFKLTPAEAAALVHYEPAKEPTVGEWVKIPTPRPK